MEKLGKIIHPKDAKVFMDEQELVREYLHTDKITFGVSRLKPGAVGGLDTGHAVADEVFFCMQGHVLCYFPEDDTYYELEQGDALADFVGPLGHPSEFIHEDLDTLRKKRFLFVAGGVGTAPVYPQVKWLHEHGVKADVIIGAKTKSMLIYTEEMARVADNLYIATDDGSEGFKGMVTALIKDLIDNRGKQYDVCVAIGPMIMMKFVTLTTKEYSLPTVVSLNTLMVDGTGMCGACRVTVGGKTVFTCVDGPEFDGFQVDFDEAMRRQGMYRTQEERARAIEQERENGHKCRVGLDK